MTSRPTPPARSSEEPLREAARAWALQQANQAAEAARNDRLAQPGMNRAETTAWHRGYEHMASALLTWLGETMNEHQPRPTTYARGWAAGALSNAAVVHVGDPDDRARSYNDGYNDALEHYGTDPATGLSLPPQQPDRLDAKRLEKKVRGLFWQGQSDRGGTYNDAIRDVLAILAALRSPATEPEDKP